MLRTNPEFLTAYAKLNAEQRQAVDQIDGPVMVLAGPGTGKTQILATRIANILQKTDTPASSILAVTFTESGAVAMRKRLISLIGETAYQVHISTFHSFCLDVITSNAEYFPQISGSENIADFDRFELFQEIFQRHSFQYIKPLNAPLLYLRDAMGNIQNLKREGVLPLDFQQLLDQEARFLENDAGTLKKTEREKRLKQLQKNIELLEVYRQYQQQLQARGQYDFEDMITFTIQAFEQHELLLREYQERFLYFLVDEYQDTNSEQNRIVQLLSSFWGEAANLFVVGDPHQSIYRFQGASLENIYSFFSHYPSAKLISLKENYRSTQEILDAARSLIAHNHSDDDPANAEHPINTQAPLLHAQSTDGVKLQIAQVQTHSLEQVFVAEEIRKLLDSGVPAHEIVIICRKNDQLLNFAQALYKWGIATHVEGGSDVLKDPVVNQLLLLFQVILHVRTGVEDVDLFTILNYELFGLSREEIFLHYRQANQAKTSFWEHIQAQNSTDDSTSDSPLHASLARLIQWSTLEPTITFPQFFETVLTESGFLHAALERADSISILNKLNSLFAEVKRLTHHDHTFNLERFLSVISTMREHRIRIPEDQLEADTQAVTLTTAHRSKGLEWQYVFITNGVDKNWGNNREMKMFTLPEGILQFSKVDKITKNEDERRLFYVVLTRAKKQVTITIPSKISSGSGMKETVPSLFTQEIASECTRQVDPDQTNGLPALVSRLLHSSFSEPEPSPTERELIASILERFKLSSTALNTYLECAYKFKLNNLLHIPRAKSSVLAFGTAVHAALEKLNRHLMVYQGEVLRLEDFLASFEAALKLEILTKEDFIARLDRGRQVLEAYYHTHAATAPTPLAVEQNFGKGGSRTMLGDIPLTGKMDKLEWADKVAKTIRVVDYKTGKPKTRGQIDGNTQDSDGRYKRQLVFYKLLIELDRSFPYQLAEAEFDFVEPGENGKFKREKFVILEDEVIALRSLIREVMAKIRNQEFPRTTQYNICHSCPFKDHCWPEGVPQIKN